LLADPSGFVATSAISQVALPIVIRRVLSADEVLRLYTEQRDNPFGILKQRARVLYFDAPSFPVLSSLSVSNITSSGGRLTAST
jgi:hypothetical protein